MLLQEKDAMRYVQATHTQKMFTYMLACWRMPREDLMDRRCGNACYNEFVMDIYAHDMQQHKKEGEDRGSDEILLSCPLQNESTSPILPSQASGAPLFQVSLHVLRRGEKKRMREKGW